MNKLITNGITSAMMALGLCSAPIQAYSTNTNRSYIHASGIDDALIRQNAGHQPVALSNQLNSSVKPLSHSLMHLSPSRATGVELKSNSFQAALLENSVPEALNLEIKKKQLVTELIIIDEAVPDKHAFYKDLKPGVDIVNIRSDQDGLQQLKHLLSRYINLDALHIVSHANDGVVYLGNTEITEHLLKHEVDTLASLNDSLKDGGDILFYGCNLASGQQGESFIELIAHHANVDVAASSNLTGNASAQGDWELELATGTIDTLSPFSPASLKDFSSVLVASDGLKNFAGWSGNGTFTLSTTDFNLTGNDDSGAETLTIYGGSVYMTDPGAATAAAFFLQADGTNTGSFELTALQFKEYAINRNTTNVFVRGYVAGGGTVTSSTLSGTGARDTFSFGAGQLGSFSGQQLTGFKVFFDTSQVDYSQIDSFTIVNASSPNSAPTLSGVPASVTVTEDLASDVNLSAITAADSDGDSLTLTLTANSGTLAASSGGSVTVGGSGTGTMTLAGTAANINTYLDTTTNIKYTTAANDTTARNIAVKANDGTVDSATSNVTVNISDIADIIADSVPANGTYGNATNLDFTLTFDESVTVSGTPRIALNIGGVNKYATFSTGNATATSGTVLTFRYAVETGLLDLDGIGVTNAVDLNSGSIIDTDLDGSGADLSNVSFASTAGVLVNSADSDGNLTSAAGVSEPVNLAWSVDTVGEAVSLFDFTLTDGGSADGLAMTASNIVVNVSGTASDTDRDKVTWRLNGNDAVNVVGTYNSGSNTITFAALSISIADGASEIYTVNGYYNDNTGLTAGNTIILSLDGDTDVTIGASGTQMGATSAINNGSGTVITDDISPVVTSVSVPANSTYGASANLDFTVNFDENVTVNTGGGTPRLSLTIGATGRFADYISGSGTSALVFREVVVSGDQDLDGISLGATIDPNSGTLRDSSGNNINTTLNSVGSLASVLVDALAPTVAEVTPVSTPGNDSTPDVTFSTNEAGTLAVGGSCGSADEGAVSSGNSTITLTQPDNSTPLTAGTYNDCTVTVTDSSGNSNTPVILSSFTLDLAAPTVSSVTVPANATYVSGQNLDFTINFDENVTVNTGGGTPQLALTIGATTRQATYQSGSGSSSLLYRYTIQSGDADSDGIAIGTLASNGGTLRDAAGNNANLTLNSVGSTASVLVDAVAPVVSSVNVPANGVYINGQNLDFTINFDESITVNTSGGTPQLALTVGAIGRQAVYLSGSGSSSLLFRYTVQSGETDTDGIDVGSLASNGGTLRDGAGNIANITLNSVGSTASVLVDAAAPIVSSVNVPANATYIASQNLDFTVNFDENITVNTTGGTPQLSITVGATARQATYVSGSGSTALLFRYTVQNGDNDTDGIAVGTLSANGGTLRDSASNDATLTLNGVGTTTSILVDAAAPTVSSVSVPANATYIASQNLDFTVNFDENITVNTTGGTPQLSIIVGATARQATYVSGSGSTALLFRYTVQNGDNDTDGITVGTLSANGGTLRDSASNDATLTLNSVGSTSAVLVDALASTISSISIPNTAHKVGDVVTATITVSADTDDYTTGSGGITGTIAGYALGSLSKTNDTTYTATFTITDGGTDVAAGSNIPVNFTLTDSVGNTGSAYTTAINQNADAVYANLPDVDLTASTNTIAEDGGSSILTATMSGSLNNQWPVDITVNLVYSGTATIATDYTKSDSITISSGSSTGASTVTAVADTLYDAAIAETVIIDISSVSVGSEGSTNQQTISITDAESAPTVSLSVGSNTIIENGGTSTITASLSHPTYENVTVNLGYSGTALSGTDYGVPSAFITVVAGSISANATTGISSIDDSTSEDSETIIIDITSVTGGGATENAVQQQTISLTDDDNVAPVITSTAVTTIDEDALYSYTFTVTDSNTSDTLTLSAPTLPTWLSFNPSTGVLSGTPTNGEIGPHVVKLRVNDGTIDVDQDFTITVANTNDAPTITGTPITSAVEGVAYSFTVIGADVDVGASLNYVLSNQPAWLSVNSSGLVSGTPTNSDVGTATNIVISVSDGTETTSLPAFNIVVDADMDGDGIGNAVDTDIDGDGMSNDFETANGLDPLDPSDATGDLDGDGISNLDEFINNTDPTADDYGPIISLDSNVVIDAVALLTDLPDGLASAVDALDGEVVVTHDLTSELLKPGRYTINWSAEDAAGNVTIETQTLDVRPIANWQVDQETSEGNIVTVSLYLNGEAPEYPVVADYTVLGTATNPEDHDAVSGSLTITEGRRGSITLNIVSDANLETDETIIFELDSITNAVAGVKQEHIVTIGELNHPPAVALSAALDSAPAKKLNVFSTTDGMVTITATVSDVDTGDAHTFEWLGGNKLNGTVTGNTYSFDPATAGKGVYQLTVKASDDASNPKSGSAVITLTILSESLVLSNTTDSDSDGIDDLTEGFGDVDEDNVPDFADDIEASNVLAMYPTGGASSEGAWFVETQDGLSLKLNLYASGSAKYSPLLTAQQIVDENDRDRSDGGYIYDGGIFDFVVSNMPVHGQTVLVVIPQLQAIPENPVYRKLIDNTWSEYVVDANNTLQSAPGKLGVCPPPGSTEYTDGLTEGYFCVQLGIEDGGMNDADGEVNGTILDPGGVGKGIPVSIRSSGGSISWPLLLLLSCLAITVRRRQTNYLRKGV